MLTIRLSRVGRKKHPHYRLVIAEKARDTYGRSLEILGHYHPVQKEDKDKLVINKERIEHWLKNGAQASNTVHNLLVEAGIIKDEKKRSIGKYKSKKEAPAEEAKPEEKKEEAPKAEAPKEEVTEEKKEAPAEEAKPEEKKEESAPAGEDEAKA